MREKKEGSTEYRNHCKKNKDLEGLSPGDVLGNKGDWILHDCGCCDESLTFDGARLKNVNARYCKAPICTPEDASWEPCDGADRDSDSKSSKSGDSKSSKSGDSKSSKSSKKGGGKKVKAIKVCVYDDEGFEERCVDPFYTPVSVNEIVVCGPCSA